MPATSASSVATVPSHSAAPRRKRRHASAEKPLLSNRATLGILGVLGVSFLASLLIIAVHLLP